MVTAAALARALLAAALTAGVGADPSPSSTPELLMTPDDAIAGSLAPRMQACDSGGLGAPTCEVNCHIVFNFYTSQCRVTCRSGYYACCSCDQGCHCVIDHDEMWPLPPGDPVP